MAAATAAAPMKAPSRRGDDQLAPPRALPVLELKALVADQQPVLAGRQRKIDGARIVVGRLGEDLDRPGWQILTIRVARAVTVHVEGRAERHGLDLQPRRDRLQLEEERLGLGDVDVDDAGLPLVVRLGHVDPVAPARDGEVVRGLAAGDHSSCLIGPGDPNSHVIGDGVDDEGALALVDALDPVVGQPGELPGGHLGHVGLVVGAGVLQPAQQVLALGHHEHRRRARLDLVGLGELDQRLLVLAGIEQLNPRLVVLACLDRGVIGARGRPAPASRIATTSRQALDERITCPDSPLWTPGEHRPV